MSKKKLILEQECQRAGQQQLECLRAEQDFLRREQHERWRLEKQQQEECQCLEREQEKLHVEKERQACRQESMPFGSHTPVLDENGEELDYYCDEQEEDPTQPDLVVPDS